MVSMAILAIAMSAIVGVNVGAMSMSGKTKGYTIAPMLARSKMIDVEEKIREKGFPEFDETEDGDFADDGFPNINWTYEVLKVKIPAPDVSRIDMSNQAGNQASRPPSEGLGITPVLQSNSMLMAGLPLLLDQLERAIREVRVTVSWMEGKREQSFAVTTHIVNIPGADVGTGVQQVSVPQQGPAAQTPSAPPNPVMR
jgi:general secretion pathway protein I